MHVPTPTSAHTPFLQAGNGHASLHDAVFDRLLRERIVFLGSQVDDDIANQICAQLLLSADDPHRDVHLYTNSPGGSVSAGMAVHDTMRFIDCDVATYSFGMAASVGQFLLIAGDSDRDRWFAPEEAREYGLVDHVVASAGALPVPGNPVAAP